MIKLALTLMIIIHSSSILAYQDSLYLKATVRHGVGLKLKKSAEADSLDLKQGFVSINVAHISELSNSSAGHKIMLESKNGGFKDERFVENKPVSYIIHYLVDGKEWKINSLQKKVLIHPASANYSEKSLSISYKGDKEIDSKYFSDQIYYTILSN